MHHPVFAWTDALFWVSISANMFGVCVSVYSIVRSQRAWKRYVAATKQLEASSLALGKVLMDVTMGRAVVVERLEAGDAPTAH